MPLSCYNITRIGDYMTEEMKKKISLLKANLYKGLDEVESIDKISLQKNLFELLRECIKNRVYSVEIGSYEININPEDLSVKYETDDTTIEISNEDVYYETTRELECRYFVIDNNIQDEYPFETKAVRVTGIVTNIDGDCEEHYELELLTNEVDKIKNYLTLSNFNVAGCMYSSEEATDDYSAIIKKEIKTNDKRTDVIDFFLPNKAISVTYEPNTNKYIRDTNQRKVYNPSDYSVLLPILEEKKNVINYIYSSIVEFYTNYINNNN